MKKCPLFSDQTQCSTTTTVTTNSSGEEKFGNLWLKASTCGGQKQQCSNESEIFASIETMNFFSPTIPPPLPHVVRDPLRRFVTRNLHGAVQFTPR